MNVFWTETAVNHLTSIYSYIFLNSPQIDIIAVLHGSQKLQSIEEE